MELQSVTCHLGLHSVSCHPTPPSHQHTCRQWWQNNY